MEHKVIIEKKHPRKVMPTKNTSRNEEVSRVIQLFVGLLKVSSSSRVNCIGKMQCIQKSILLGKISAEEFCAQLHALNPTLNPQKSALITFLSKALPSLRQELNSNAVSDELNSLKIALDFEKECFPMPCTSVEEHKSKNVQRTKATITSESVPITVPYISNFHHIFSSSDDPKYGANSFLQNSASKIKFRRLVEKFPRSQRIRGKSQQINLICPENFLQPLPPKANVSVSAILNIEMDNHGDGDITRRGFLNDERAVQIAYDFVESFLRSMIADILMPKRSTKKSNQLFVNASSITVWDVLNYFKINRHKIPLFFQKQIWK